MVEQSNRKPKKVLHSLTPLEVLLKWCNSTQNVGLMPARLQLELVLCASALILAGCTAPATAPNAPTLAVFPGTPTKECVQEEVLPKIQEVRPAEIRAGSEVMVTASGGYLKDNCGGFIEGARMYKLYFDDEPFADLSCYVNHCEGKFVLPTSVTAGRHCLGVQKGTCQLEVDVVGG